MSNENKKTGVFSYKNTLMIFGALVLFSYAALISVVPSVMTNSFDVDKFEQKMQDATSLVTSVGSVEYKVAPSLKTTITVKNLSLKYVDNQPLFDARQIDLETSIFALLGKSFDVKNIQFKNTIYADQILPNGQNKIAFLPQAFNSEVFGAKSISVTPGPAKFNNLKITYVTPKTYKEEFVRERSFSAAQVGNFLKSFDYSHVQVK